MTLEEAINHAENMAPLNFGVSYCSPGFSNLIYYVIKWNNEFSVCSNSYIRQHQEVEWIYNTRDKIIIDNGRLEDKI